MAGTLLVGGAFLAIGLSPIGPIAGGALAANMGPGLVTGGLMAMMQSAAMTGTAYATGAAVGAAGATIGADCILENLFIWRYYYLGISNINVISLHIS